MYEQVPESGHLHKRLAEAWLEDFSLSENVECFRLGGGHSQAAVGNQMVGEVKRGLDCQMKAALHDSRSLPVGAVCVEINVSKLLELCQIRFQGGSLSKDQLAINHGCGV